MNQVLHQSLALTTRLAEFQSFVVKEVNVLDVFTVSVGLDLVVDQRSHSAKYSDVALKTNNYRNIKHVTLCQ